MKLPKISTFVALVLSGYSMALAAPTSFVYEGLLQDSSGNPITVSSSLTLAIYDPGLGCLLYEESQTVTPTSDGSFSVLIGSKTGASKRTANDPQLPMDKIFSSGLVRSSGSGACSSGYTANISDSRKLVVSVDGIPLSPAVEISSAPFAVTSERSEKVGNYDSSKLLRSDGSNTVSALSDAQIGLLMNLLSGSLGTPTAGGDPANKSYVDNQLSSQASLMLSTSTAFAGDVSGTYGALSVQKLQGYAVDSTTPAANQVLKWNGSKWTPTTLAMSITSSDVTTALGYTPLNASVTTTGEANKLLSLDTNGEAFVKGLKISGNGSSGVHLKDAGSGSSYQLTFPSGAPAAGQSLQSDGSGQLSWVSQGSFITSISANTPLSVTGGANPVISLSAGAYPFLKNNGSTWSFTNVNISDLKSSVDGSAQIPTTCTISQTLVWSAILDIFTCADIKLNNVASVTTAPLVFYVKSSGSDSLCNGSGDQGYSGSSNCAFATIQKALDSTPDIVKHDVEIRIVDNLSMPAGKKVVAVVDKVIATVDETTGPKLIISGYIGAKNIQTNYGGNSSGFLIMKQSRAVVIKDLSLTGFSGTAIDNSGGVVLLDNVTLNTNSRGLSVSGAGMAMFVNSGSNIYNPNGTKSVGISLENGSSVSIEGNLSISSGDGQGSRAIEISRGEFSVQNSAILSIADVAGFNQVSGIEISNGGRLYSCDNCTIAMSMYNGNSNSSAINVRGGELIVSGDINFYGLGGTGLVCDTGATCQFYKTFYMNNNAASTVRPVVVRNQSSLLVYGDFQISPTISGGNAAVYVTDGSNFSFMPNTSRNLTFSNAQTGATAIALDRGSNFSVEAFISVNLNFASAFQNAFRASNGSHISMNANSWTGGTNTNDVLLDESSNFKINSNTVFSNAPKRLCPMSTTSVGSGPASFCIEPADNSSTNYFSAQNSCASKNLKLCNSEQYAMYCAQGNTISGSHWAKDTADVYCSSSSSYTRTPASSGLDSINYQYRCCL